MYSDLLNTFEESRIMAIFRGETTQEILDYTELLRGIGISYFEVTLNAGDPFRAMEALRSEYGSQLPIGAGTVMTRVDVERAVDHGAEFIVCPHVDELIIERGRELGVPVVPGAFTPTELSRAVAAGAEMVKLFPISPVGSDYIRQIRGPFPEVKLMTTGGVSPELARSCIKEGANGVGVGMQLLGSLTSPAELTRCARDLLQSVR